MSVQLVEGMHIKHYRLDARLGAGASGEVWRATRDSTTVAMKFLLQEHVTTTDEKLRKQLENEAEALIALRHLEGVPRLLDADIHFKFPYIVMNFVEGVTLAQYIKSRHIFEYSLETRLDVLAQIATIIDAIHTVGWVHRDIKSANILGVPNPCLVDFSISYRHVNHLPTDGFGTITHIPPDGVQDILGDLYSFGVVVYETLFAQHPFVDEYKLLDPTLDVTSYIVDSLEEGSWSMPSMLDMSDYPADMRQLNRKRLDQVFKQALGDRAERYSTATELVTALYSTVVMPVNVAPANPTIAVREPSTPSVPLEMIIGVVIVVAIILVVAVTMFIY